MVTINFRGDGSTKVFKISEAVSGVSSIFTATVDGVTAPLHATVPLLDGCSVQLATAPANGSVVAISYKSAVVDKAF